MFDSPDSLANICVEFITQNVNSVFSLVQENNTYKYVFKDSSTCLPSSVSEPLFASLDEKTLTDKLLTIFDPSVTRLRRVHISNASKISSKGLRILRSHKITELVAVKSTNITVNDIIGCLGDWTLQNLRLLNVSQSTFGNNEKVRVVIALSKLKSLKCLDVSFTEFNSQGLQIITTDLPCLESLNISGTIVSDIWPLKKCKDRLKYLNMYNVKATNPKEALGVIAKLHMLQHLDISEDNDEIFQNAGEAEGDSGVNCSDFLEALCQLPNLVSLDLSGRAGFEANQLK
ncbi:hypothetical protein JTE90_009695 [Oedothorax gibbosus]|uniref:Zer-1-like leucine-rich repeats region domain-containing protein n=1 Tax=Oedothorax gibbosus TaxID=931172 RepID=A0AAV6V8Q6_9ARAC|nr:hypothetical protein JTE90_009695 [Oedothorax gibbosus]